MREQPKFGKPTLHITGGDPDAREEYIITRIGIGDDDALVAEYVESFRWREEPDVKRPGKAVLVLTDFVTLPPMSRPCSPTRLEVETASFLIRIPTRPLRAAEMPLFPEGHEFAVHERTVVVPLP